MTQLPQSGHLVVVDASALFTLADHAGVRGTQIASFIGSRQMFVPSIAEYEVTNVLRRYEADERFGAERAARVYARFRAIPLRVIGFSGLADRIWELRLNVRTSDAAYVALAEAMGADLVTTDARLSRAPGIRCSVVVFDRDDPQLPP